MKREREVEERVKPREEERVSKINKGKGRGGESTTRGEE